MGWLTTLAERVKAVVYGEQGIANPMARLGSAMGGWPAVTDDLLTKQGASDIYLEMQHDPEIRAALTVVTSGLLSRGWELVPHENDDGEMQFVLDVIDEMRGSFDDILDEVLRDRAILGTAIVERVWKLRPDGRVVYEALKPRDPRLYSFDLDEYNNIKRMLLQVNGEKMEVDPAKFAIFANRPVHGEPWGTSELRGAYRWYWLKKQIVQFWGCYLEKFGMPTVKGVYKTGLPRDGQQELLKVLERIQQETAIVVPDTVDVELLAANVAAHGGGFESAIAYCDKQIAKAIVGQTLTSDEGQRVGSMALGRVHQDILDTIIVRQRRTVEEWVDEEIIRPLVDQNYLTRAYPNFVLPLDERDMKSLSDVIFKLVSCEVVNPRESWVREYLGLPEREELPPEWNVIPAEEAEETTNEPEGAPGTAPEKSEAK